MRLDEKTNKLLGSFQRYIRNGEREEIESYSISELRSADEQLGNKDVNASWRIAIRNPVGELELKEQRRHESKVRAWNFFVGVLVGLLIAVLADLLLDT